MNNKSTEKTYYKNLKILFWNTRSLIQRKTELLTQLRKFDICVCVETWLSDEDKIHFPEFVTFRKDRQHSRGGGIIILVRKNLAYAEIRNIQTPDISVEMCGIHLNNITPALDLIIRYRTPGFSLTQNQWDQIIQNANSSNHVISTPITHIGTATTQTPMAPDFTIPQSFTTSTFTIRTQIPTYPHSKIPNLILSSSSPPSTCVTKLTSAPATKPGVLTIFPYV